MPLLSLYRPSPVPLNLSVWFRKADDHFLSQTALLRVCARTDDLPFRRPQDAHASSPKPSHARLPRPLPDPPLLDPTLVLDRRPTFILRRVGTDAHARDPDQHCYIPHL